MNAFNVSDNIGFDGNSYYCRRCGKAGYERPTQVRGHLSLCRGTLARKGIPPTSTSTSTYKYLQPLSGAVDGALGDGQQVLQPLEVGPVDSVLVAKYESLDRRMSAMENEYNHVLVRNNPPINNNDWFGQNKGLVIMVVIVAFIFWTMNQSSCPSNCGESNKTGRSRVSSLGEKAAAKLIDRGITKSVDKLFG